MRKTVILSATLLAATIHPALSQDGEGNSMQAMKSGDQFVLPEKCEQAAGDVDMSQMMSAMEQMMSAEGRSEASKANMRAMMQMHEPMMKAMTIEDADVAFNCGMIVHHQGGIAMSEIELEMGEDEKSHEMAKKMAGSQKKDIEQMTAWVDEHVE
ncbi:MAG: DUF305 domain-containing protein [Aurantimonas endophytica]|uniref:DUF305 domain-containing protein n=1 Tax=Aurantimonas endophytica TaxID=1522175 RepID=UPI0030013AC8